MNVTLLQNLRRETFVLFSRHFVHSHRIASHLSVTTRAPSPPQDPAAMRMRTTSAHAQCTWINNRGAGGVESNQRGGW